MKLLITGALKLTDEMGRQICDAGHEIVFLQNEKDTLPVSYENIDGIICNGLFLSHPIEKFKNLRYIQLTSAGYDRVPMQYVSEHGIAIYNARGVYSIPIAETVLAGVLQLYRQCRSFEKNQKQHLWEKSRQLPELCGKTVCIVGCGNVGMECAVRFRAFGCTVIGADIQPYKSADYEVMYPIEKIDTALKEADVVVITAPLTKETSHMFDKSRFAVMKPAAILVNVARGEIVDTAALEDALRDGLGGAVLDVFETEPLDAQSPLWDNENVVIFPHNSFVGDGNEERLNHIILKNLERAK